MPTSVTNSHHEVSALTWFSNTAKLKERPNKLKGSLSNAHGADDDDDDFPTTSSAGSASSSPPGFFFISGGAAASAMLAISVAGLGMVGMFMLGNYMSQVMKGLQASGNTTQHTSTEAVIKPVTFSTLQLAELVRQRRADLEVEIKKLKDVESPMRLESKDKVKELRSDIELLSRAGSGRV
ncbi:hypothetical protein CEUSTIGMA_g4686.t1 [Chlamydomonas eustigma]|uniref:Uncharacterized protein n=1 Tax=Chlamydomonas eustigma TaxID=1157962 RepID=A0A250X2S3_9CHLO|nr:hypothetical protein CEUSTIGMA_g4686.t1 [Chlamydomonas eustigma]|eukprot:GAX77239.1 hypothetical protein CEUSTIGMA_g4686.t1 [Chlamydomonas eustigma]